MQKITIIGGGASGSLLAINLVKHHAVTAAPLEINLIEKSGETGRGVAYGTTKGFHLLNVPAAKMGAFPDDIEHFYNWLVTNGYDYLPESFVPRKIYGDYLQQVFRETISVKPEQVKISVLESEAVDVAIQNGETKVLLKNGAALISDKIVLAFGNFLPPNVRTVSNDYIRSPRYFRSPWRADIPAAIDKNENVLIIGTGLTGIDVILSLYNNNHQGKIYALSTHGLLPTVHAPAKIYPSFQAEIEGCQTVRQMLKTVRKHFALAESSGNNWRAVIDSLRPFTQETWFRLPLTEKRCFMRHLQRRWDVARHRMPPECFGVLQDLQTAKQLRILRGRIDEINLTDAEKFLVAFGNNSQIEIDRVINCTGSESNYARIDQPLIKNLMTRGEIKPDALSIGLETAPSGEIINQRGEVSKTFYTFATAQKGVLWECTAMPDIRKQAQKLALRLLKNLKPEI